MGENTREGFLPELVRIAFLVRLVALLLVALLPREVLASPRGLLALGVVTFVSAIGLFQRERVMRAVARHPGLVVVDVLAAAAVTWLLGVQSPLVFYGLSTALLIGLLLEPAVAALATTILISTHLLVAFEGSAPSTDEFAYGLVIPVIYVVLVALGTSTRRLYEQAVDEQAYSAGLQAQAAAADERARLARDMHDSIAKTLHGMSLAAAALPHWVERDPEVAVERAAQLRDAAESAANEARALLVGLREDQDDRPLASLLRERVSAFQERTGVPARMSLDAVVDVEHAVRVQVVKVVDEALENVYRHADASAVSVVGTGRGDDLVLEIEDDGDGFDAGAPAPYGHYGVVGMTERAAAVGGRLDVHSSPGAGTRVVLTVPLVQRVAVSS